MTRHAHRALVIAPVLALLALVARPAAAQDDAAKDDASVRQGLAITRADIQADRKSIVAGSLPLTDAQAKVFWPMYDAYRADVSILSDRMQEIILEYAKEWNGKSLTDDKALSLMDRWMRVREDEAALNQRWAKRLREQVPGIVVSRFFQIENRLNLIVQLELASEIPLMRAQQ